MQLFGNQIGNQSETGFYPLHVGDITSKAEIKKVPRKFYSDKWNVMARYPDMAQSQIEVISCKSEHQPMQIHTLDCYIHYYTTAVYSHITVIKTVRSTGINLVEVKLGY